MWPFLFWSLLLLWIFYLSKAYQDLIYVACSAVLMKLMHARLFQSTSIVWLCAWAWFFSTFHSLLNKNRPWFWRVFWAAAIFTLRKKMHPDSSLEQFLKWTASLWGLRLAMFPIQIFYAMIGDESQGFPFNIISPWWRLSKPLWQPAGKDRQPKNYPELCEACRGFVSRSSLIMGSRFPLTRLVEWHKVWTSSEELRVSAENRNEPCHVCKLVWYSISETRRRKICESRSAVSDQKVKTSKENISSQGSVAASEKEQSKQPELGEPPQRNKSTRNWATRWFGIKVWEERPLSPYTYIQLFHNGAKVGSRLLAHRGAHFMEREFPPQNDMKKSK